MKNQQKLFAHLALLATGLLFGANYWISKNLTGILPVEALVVFRTLGATIIFWAFSLIYPREKVNKNDLLLLAVAGVIGIAINQLFFFYGLKLSNSVDVSIIHITNPFFVVILTVVFLKSKISGIKLLGIVTGAIGAVILIANSGRISFHPEYFKGNLFILINTFAYAVFLVMIKPLLSKYSTITVMKWVYLAGAIVVLPYGYSIVTAVDYQSLTLIPVLSILYIIIAITFLAYLLSAFALKQLSPPVVSFYVYLQPLSAAFIALLLGKGVLNYYQLLAAIFIFTGVYFVSKK